MQENNPKPDFYAIKVLSPAEFAHMPPFFNWLFQMRPDRFNAAVNVHVGRSHIKHIY